MDILQHYFEQRCLPKAMPQDQRRPLTPQVMSMRSNTKTMSIEMSSESCITDPKAQFHLGHDRNLLGSGGGRKAHQHSKKSTVSNGMLTPPLNMMLHFVHRGYQSLQTKAVSTTQNILDKIYFQILNRNTRMRGATTIRLIKVLFN